MTHIINIYGGPGIGKSTVAAKTFASLKELGCNAELVTEYVKQWAWESRTPVNYDQFYLFGQQARKEYTLLNKVDFVVTDAPVELCCYYAQLYGTPEQAVLFRSMALCYREMIRAEGHRVSNIFLRRTKPYQKHGRFQTEDQAIEIDKKLFTYLKELGLSLEFVNGNEDANANIIKHIHNFILDKNPNLAKDISADNINPTC